MAGNPNLRPAPRGNRLAVRHDAYSAIRIPARADEIAEWLREIVPASSAADDPTIRLAAIAPAQVEVVSAYLVEAGIVDGKGRPAPVLKHFGTMLNTAARLLSALGCTPTSRASLGLDLVRTEGALESMIADGARIVSNAERRLESA